MSFLFYFQGFFVPMVDDAIVFESLIGFILPVCYITKPLYIRSSCMSAFLMQAFTVTEDFIFHRLLVVFLSSVRTLAHFVKLFFHCLNTESPHADYKKQTITVRCWRLRVHYGKGKQQLKPLWITSGRSASCSRLTLYFIFCYHILQYLIAFTVLLLLQ